MLTVVLLALVTRAVAQGFPETCPPVPPYNPNATLGVCPTDFTIIGPALEAVHESETAPTGFAVDNSLGIYLTYPRNTGATPVNVAKATSFASEEPWPNAAIQNCTADQDLAECFINVQNVVLDSVGQLWVVDSGIKPGAKTASSRGAKIISFNQTTGDAIRTYIIPDSLLYDSMNANDVRINNTLGAAGYAFITDESASGSVLAINLDDGTVVRRLYNTTVVKADPKYVGSYNGEPIYLWNGTTKSYATTGADGIALASGNVYWGVLASRRFYFISQVSTRRYFPLPWHIFRDVTRTRLCLLSTLRHPTPYIAPTVEIKTSNTSGRSFATEDEKSLTHNSKS